MIWNGTRFSPPHPHTLCSFVDGKIAQPLNPTFFLLKNIELKSARKRLNVNSPVSQEKTGRYAFLPTSKPYNNNNNFNFFFTGKPRNRTTTTLISSSTFQHHQFSSNTQHRTALLLPVSLSQTRQQGYESKSRSPSTTTPTTTTTIIEPSTNRTSTDVDIRNGTTTSSEGRKANEDGGESRR